MSRTPNAEPADGSEVQDTDARAVDQGGKQAASSDGAPRGGGGRIHWRRLLQRKLLIKVTIPTLIGLFQLTLVIIAIVTDQARAIILLWALPALLVGFWFGRRFKIGWDDEGAQVSLIQAQVLLAVSYIVVRFGTHWVLDRTLGEGAAVADVVLLVSFGLFFGRSVGLAVEIWEALSGQQDQPSASA